HDDYVAAAEETAGRPLRDYFDECITGTAPLQHRLARALAYVGCTLHTEPVAERPGCLTVCITADGENTNRRKWLSLRSEVRTQRSEL
ncbi:MAG: hypothetical protein MUD08_14760, partial [Cytophagales bacterium]|nr:hypothetical protein [Cytophagales bacterium]